MPKQIPADQSTYLEGFKVSAAAAQTTVVAVAASTAIANILFVGALSQVWGLINGLQLFVHLPLIGIELPEHTTYVLGKLITVAQFDIVENQLVYGEVITFEEEVEGNLRTNFVNTGYESDYAFVNMGTNVIILTILLFAMLLLLICAPCRNRRNCIGRAHRKCSGIVFWNFWLRLLIEGCLEIAISAGLYLLQEGALTAEREANPAYFLTNDIMSYFLLSLLLVLPIFILAFYCKNFERLGEEEFAAVWGSPYEGLRTETRSVLFFPVYFLIRRYLFSAAAFWMFDYGNLQVHILICLTMISTVYLLAFRPFKAVILQRLEVFNEVTSFVLLYICAYFTPFVDVEEHFDLINDLGKVFIAIMVMNLSVHLFFLGRSSFISCKNKVKARR